MYNKTTYRNTHEQIRNCRKNNVKYTCKNTILYLPL